MAILMSFSLVGCSNIENGSTLSLQSNDETLNSLLRTALTDESYLTYLSALDEQQKRLTYVDIEDEYHKAELDYYNDYLEALNMGIIDTQGIPTGKLNDISFEVEKYSYDDLMNIVNSFVTKEEFINWLRGLNILTEGRELTQDENSRYVDVLISKLNLSPTETIGFTVEELDKASLDDLRVWFKQFYSLELNNVDKYRESIKRPTYEELVERANKLLTQDFTNPKTSDFVSSINGRHILTEDTIKSFGALEDNLVLVTVKNHSFTIDTSTLGKLPVYSDTYKAVLSNDKKSVTLSITINGKNEDFVLPFDDTTNNLKVSKYDIYRLLGMKIYVE